MYSTRVPPRRFCITIRVSSDERDRIESAAAHAGFRVSGYVRAILVNAKPLRAARRPAVAVQLLGVALARLGSIASLLAQLAGVPTLTSTERALVRELGELKICRALVMKALGRNP